MTEIRSTQRVIQKHRRGEIYTNTHIYNSHTHTDAYTHIYMCVCVCVCVRAFEYK